MLWKQSVGKLELSITRAIEAGILTEGGASSMVADFAGALDAAISEGRHLGKSASIRKDAITPSVMNDRLKAMSDGVKEALDRLYAQEGGLPGSPEALGAEIAKNYNETLGR